MGREGNLTRIFALHVFKEKHHKLKHQLTLSFRVYICQMQKAAYIFASFFPVLHFNNQ